MKNIKLFFKAAGPGIVTGAADDDPSGIATYTLAGAQFGTLFLWTALVTWPLMAVVQMACARIGIATGEGLAATLRKKFPRPVVLIFCIALLFANTLNIGADLSAMSDCLQMLVGGNYHLYVILIAALISYVTVQWRYAALANTLKWLSFSLLSYIVVAFLVSPHWSEVFRATFTPRLPNKNTEWSMLVAILGTTISPYLFFWQASQEVEEERKESRPHDIKFKIRRYDVGAGTFFSNIVMFFIILATALTLNKTNFTNITTSREAAEALAPLAGRFASLLYTVGLLGVGFLAIPTLTGSSAYAFSELFQWNYGLDTKLKKAKAFYGVILGSTIFAVLFNFLKVNPMKALYWSAVVNGVLAPFLLLGILIVMRNKKIMGGEISSKKSEWILAFCTLLMFAASACMLTFQN